jgi:hypothetical protein
MVFCFLNHHQLVNDDAQLRPAKVSIEAFPKDGSVSLFAVVFVVVVVVLARASANA